MSSYQEFIATPFIPNEILRHLFTFIDGYKEWVAIVRTCKHFRDVGYDTFDIPKVLADYLWEIHESQINLPKLIQHPAFERASISSYYMLVCDPVKIFEEQGKEVAPLLLRHFFPPLERQPMIGEITFLHHTNERMKCLKDYIVALQIACKFGLGNYCPLSLFQKNYPENALIEAVRLALNSADRDTLFAVLFDTNFSDNVYIEGMFSIHKDLGHLSDGDMACCITLALFIDYNSQRKNEHGGFGICTLHRTIQDLKTTVNRMRRIRRRLFY